MLFLGFVLATDGLSPDRKKTKALVNWSTLLKDKQDVERFAGLCHIIEWFCRIVLPLPYPSRTWHQRRNPPKGGGTSSKQRTDLAKACVAHGPGPA